MTHNEFIDQEKALLHKLERVVGYVPIGTKDLLKVLTHPDVIRFTKQYIFQREQEAAYCDKFVGTDWDCEQELMRIISTPGILIPQDGGIITVGFMYCDKCNARAEERRSSNGT